MAYKVRKSGDFIYVIDDSKIWGYRDLVEFYHPPGSYRADNGDNSETILDYVFYI